MRIAATPRLVLLLVVSALAATLAGPDHATGSVGAPGLNAFAQVPPRHLLEAPVAEEALELRVIRLDAVTRSEAGRATALRTLHEACSTHGAFLVEGHGVNATFMRQVVAEVSGLFSLPAADKQALSLPPGYDSLFRGFSQLGRERVYALIGVGDTPPDRVEKFSLRSANGFNVSAGQNMWPSGIQSLALQPLLEEYYRQTTRLARELFRLFAQALGQDPAFFEPWLTDGTTSPVRCLHYPAVGGEDMVRLRMGPHTDKGPMTIIPSDPSEALEYLVGGTWHRVAHRPRTFLVHLGDAMAFWSRERWLSNWHRVGYPQPGTGSRISMPHFLNMDHRMPMRPLSLPAEPTRSAGGAGPDAEQREVPRYGAWLQKQLEVRAYIDETSSVVGHRADEL